MTDIEDKWRLYVPKFHKHYHALGVLSAAFNKLEFRLLGMFLLYFGFNDVTLFLFQKQKDNSFRIDMLRRAINLKGETPAIKEAIGHFCTGFDYCAQNRNILFHSNPLTVDGEIARLAFRKPAKGAILEWNDFFLDLPGLRKVADETIDFSLYGKGVFEHIIGTYRPDELSGPHQIPRGGPLPDKPPLPTLLTPQPLPIPIDETPQPQS
jgi:hypothetical protein